MRSIIISCLALCFLPTVYFGQSFYEVFQAQDPHPYPYQNGSAYGISGSIHQNWAVVGSGNGLNEDSLGFLNGAGAAYIYRRDLKGTWAFYQKIVASDRGRAESFGYSVEVSENEMIIGSRGVVATGTGGNPPSPNPGSAYIFTLDSNEVWQETQILEASDSAPKDFFGQDVTLEQDIALVGTYHKPYIDSLGNEFAKTGAVYLFQKDQTNFWNEIQKITIPNPSGGEYFGYDIDLSGSWAAIGAPRADRNAQNQWLTDAGAVFLYQRDNQDQWNLAQVLTPSDREAFDWFGSSVSIRDSFLTVGAIWDSQDSLGQNSVTGAGSAYVFRLQPDGQWVEQQKLSGPFRAITAHFGFEVEVYENYVLVGTYAQSLNSSIAIFTSENNHWNFSGELIPTNTNPFDGFGRVVSMSGSSLLGIADNREYMYIFETCNLEETVLRDTICPNSGYDFGGEWLTVEGSYIDTLDDYRGCDSIVQLDLAVLPPQSNVYEINDGLTISAPGAIVQWLDCLNGYAPVVGATDPQFFPQQSGSYAAAISQYNCVDTSICMAFVVAGIETDLREDIQVFPNPVEHTLQLSSTMPMDQVWLHNVQGQVLKEARPHDISLSIDMSDFPAGVYLLQVQTSQGILRQKILKQ